MESKLHGIIFLSQPQLQVLRKGTFHVEPAQFQGLHHEIDFKGPVRNRVAIRTLGWIWNSVQEFLGFNASHILLK